MKARKILRQRRQVAEDAFVEMRIWRVPVPVRGSTHYYKYALAYVVDGVCVVRYDNEAGKGDHLHWGDSERGYVFTTLEALIEDFMQDVNEWRSK